MVSFFDDLPTFLSLIARRAPSTWTQRTLLYIPFGTRFSTPREMPFILKASGHVWRQSCGVLVLLKGTCVKVIEISKIQERIPPVANHCLVSGHWRFKWRWRGDASSTTDLLEKPWLCYWVPSFQHFGSYKCCGSISLLWSGYYGSNSSLNPDSENPALCHWVSWHGPAKTIQPSNVG